MKDEHRLYKEALGRMMPSFESVRSNAKRAEEPAISTTWQRRTIAAACAICVAGVIGAWVPPVRASLIDFFSGNSGRSVAAYVNTPQYERPEISNVDVQSIAPQLWTIRQYADTDLYWGSEIRDAGITEALYDSGSGELTLKYTVDGSSFGLNYGGELAHSLAQGETKESDGTYSCILDAQLVEDSSALTGIEDTKESEYAVPSVITHMSKEIVADSADGAVTLTSVFDLPASAASNELALLIPCVTAVPANDNSGLDYRHLGYIQIPFRIDAALSERKSSAPDVYTVNGYSVSITETVLSPTGLLIRFAVPQDFEVPGGDLIGGFDFNVSADGELLTTGTGEERVSYLDYIMADGDGPAEGLIRIPFAGDDIAEITLVACDPGSGDAITEDAIRISLQ